MSGTNITLTGNTEQCPRCGRVSRVMEGEFNIGAFGVQMLSGPAWTRAMLQEVQRTIRRTTAAVAATDDDSEVKQLIAGLRTELGSSSAKLDSLIAANAEGKSKEWVMFFLGVLLSIVTGMLPLAEAGDATGDFFDNIVRDVTETMREASEDDLEG